MGLPTVFGVKKIIKKTLNKVLFHTHRGIKLSVLLAQFTLAKASQMLRPLPENPKQIFFVFQDSKLYSGGDGNGRYIYLILNRFSEAGYNVYLYKQINFPTYYRLELWLRRIYKIKHLKVVSTLPRETSDIIYAFDTVDKELLKRPWKQQVYVNTFNPPFCQIGYPVWIPYFMFPGIYEAGQHRALDSYRKNTRTIRMLFAGNTKVYYDDPDIKKNYGHLTRIEGINALLGLGDKVTSGDSQEYFLDTLNRKGYAHECRILRTAANFSIRPTDWLKLISKSDFFICLSGTNLPMCHNAIEAIAVGTIPIIAYPDWFFPPLEHKKNAIVYSGKDDLIKKVNEVLMMSSEEINTMRKNVIEYYERHLTTESFMRNFESQKDDIFTIMLHPRLVCTKPEQEQNQALANLQSHPYFQNQEKLVHVA